MPNHAPRRASWSDLLELQLDPNAAVPLFRQLHGALRAAILTRRLPFATRLPATRDLATRLEISRASVVAAYEQLLAEGFIAGRIGSGSYVAVDVPALAARIGAVPSELRLSTRGQRLAKTARAPMRAAPAGQAFETGMVQLDARLRAAWRKCVLRHVAALDPQHLHYGDPLGHDELRALIADYLRVSRATQGDAASVLVTTGSQQSYDLLIKLLLDPGDTVWVEDPGYPALRAALMAAGARLAPVPVDRDGFDVARAIARAPRPKAIFVTPSHHYPTGAMLALARRVQLIEWADKTGAWIIEDDYDGEFRFTGAPLSSLQGLDRSGRVAYLGTFNKALFPGLRLGYILAAPILVERLACERQLTDQQVATPLQLVVAELIRDGHFASHIRRMRQRYLAARDVLVGALQRRLGDRLDVDPPDQGIQLVAWLKGGGDDVALALELAANAVSAKPISPMFMSARPRPGLLLGYSGFDDHAIRSAVGRMAATFAR